MMIETSRPGLSAECEPGNWLRRIDGAILHELPAEPPLHAQVSARDLVIHRRRDAHDVIVLHAELQRAADAAVRADRVGDGLLRLVPHRGLTQVVLRLEHERAGGTDADAV